MTDNADAALKNRATDTSTADRASGRDTSDSRASNVGQDEVRALGSPSRSKAGQRDESDQVLACPECDGTGLKSLPRADHDYYCQDCGGRWDDIEVVERASKGDRGSRRKGLSRTLEQAEPGDLIADGGVPTVELGELKEASVFETEDGQARVQLGGTGATAKVTIPEHMVEPFAQGIGDSVRRIYDQDDQEIVTDGGVPTVDPEQEPEFVGAHSGAESEECQHWVGEEKPTEQCGDRATHTVVYYSGTYHKVASCDEHGAPEDVEDWRRNWSVERESESDPTPVTDGGQAQIRQQQRQAQILQLQHAAEQAREQRLQMALETEQVEKQGQRIWVIPEFEPSEAESEYIQESVREALPEYNCQLAVDRTDPMTKDRIYKMLAGAEVDGKANEDQDIRTDGGVEMTPAKRLREAVKQIRLARDGIAAPVNPAEDAALARSEFLVAGVADALEDDHDEDLDPSLVTDGGHEIDPDAWYVFDSRRDAVIEECDEINAAKKAARGDEDRNVVAGRVLESIRGDTTLVWETGEVDVVTDGGVELTCPNCDHPLDTGDDNDALANDPDHEYFCSRCGELYEDDTALIADGGREIAGTLELTEDGLELPDELDTDEKFVIRTVTVTQNVVRLAPARETYPLIDGRHFRPEESDNVQNPHLDADVVSIKPYGEDERYYRVEIPDPVDAPATEVTPGP